MISFETLARQAYEEFKAEFECNTSTTIVAWDVMPGALKAAWVAAAKKLYTTLATVH